MGSPAAAAQGLPSIAELVVTFALLASPIFSLAHCLPHQFASFYLWGVDIAWALRNFLYFLPSSAVPQELLVVTLVSQCI